MLQIEMIENWCEYAYQSPISFQKQGKTLYKIECGKMSPGYCTTKPFIFIFLQYSMSHISVPNPFSWGSSWKKIRSFRKMFSRIFWNGVGEWSLSLCLKQGYDNIRNRGQQSICSLNSYVEKKSLVDVTRHRGLQICSCWNSPSMQLLNAQEPSPVCI